MSLSPAGYGVWGTSWAPPARSAAENYWGVNLLTYLLTYRAATENEFGYSTAVSIILVTIMLMILRCMFYTRKLNNMFNYRKQIARQHSCRIIIWQGRRRGRSYNNFCVIGCSWIILQNLVAVSHICCAQVSPKKFLARWTLPFRMGACLTPRNTPLPRMWYRAEFGSNKSNGAGVSRGSRRFWERCPLNIRGVSNPRETRFYLYLLPCGIWLL